MRKILLLFGFHASTYDYTKLWDYIKSLDIHYNAFMNNAVLIDTDKSVQEICSHLKDGDLLSKGYKSGRIVHDLDSFVVVDVTESAHDGYTGISLWEKWKVNS